MRSRLVFILLVGLALTACGAPLPAPIAVTLAAATAAPTAAAPTSAPSAVPTVAPTPSPTPTDVGLPWRAWTLSSAGEVFVLDARAVVHQLAPDLSRPVASGDALFGAPDVGRGYLAVSDAFIVVASRAVTRTMVLERPSFRIRADYPGAGPLAIDGSKRFYVLSDDAVWAYKLDDLSRPPVAVTTWPVNAFTPRPRNLAIDQPSRQLIVTLEDVSASPPHRQQWYQTYNLDSLEPTVSFVGGLGDLTPPSSGAAGIVAGLAAKNGLLGSKVTLFDPAGKALRAAEPFDGRPVADPAGDYIYVLRERGIWVLRASDLSLVAFEPFTGTAPTDLEVSPDGAKLYLVSDEKISVRDTAQMRAAGIAPLQGPLPAGWFYPALPLYAAGARFFPVTDEVAFVQVGGYGETWRTEDGGQTWAMLPGLVYPNFHYVTHLSISPDFATDRTLVAVSFGQPAYLRSTDGGDTWAEWTPPVAFVSDRDGGLNVYTAERGKPGAGPAQGVQRRTFSGTANQLPAWSPGWTRLAYQSNVGGHAKLFTQRADCTAGADCGVRQITDGPGDDTLPAWSPDGQWIAFVSTRDGTPQIYVVPSGGGPARQLTSSVSGAWRPAWWPDSQRLFFTGTGANGSNDIQRLGRIWQLDGTFDTPELLAVIASAADERDAAVAREYFVYLSNESGTLRTYRHYFGDLGPSFPTTAGTEPEGHPAPLDDDNGAVLVTLERAGRTGIYRATASGYEPFIVDAAFDGQPAAGPVLWQPDP